jgi:glucose/arabinose dehydrogenase
MPNSRPAGRLRWSTGVMMPLRVAACVLVTAVCAAACSSPATPATGRQKTAPPGGATISATVTAAAPAAPSATPVRLRAVRLVIPAGEGAAPFTTPRTLLMPAGWTARVWARVPDARMETWAPGGDLLVSQPANGIVTELVPAANGTAKPRTLLRGLTQPQGLAFGRVAGHWVLYVAESNRIDRYPWGSAGIDGPRKTLAGRLPDTDSSGNDVHRTKDVVVSRDGTIYFEVGSSSNASPDDLTMSPPRAVIMSVRPDGKDLRVVERGVRNGEGLALAPDGVVWTAVNNRDNIPYPFHQRYAGHADAFGLVIQSYVNNHPPDEVTPVVAGRNLGWPYCNPDQDRNHPAGSLAHVPFVADALTNPGGRHLNCAKVPRLAVGLPAHSAPLGLSFLEGSKIGGPWSGGAVVAAHGSWNREPPRPPAVLWLAWNRARRTLMPAITLISGFQLADGSRWGRPVDAVPGPGGALYVTDDTAGAVYRVLPAG